MAAVSAFYTVLNWNAEEGGSSAIHVQFSRAFFASISIVKISFCSIHTFDRLLERVDGPGRVEKSGPGHSVAARSQV